MLTTEELKKIKILQEICEEEGNFRLKLNFDMLENRAKDFQEDFLHYEDNKLVGFLGLYHMGDSIEICGMVHPVYRRQGIFTKLFKKGIKQAYSRNIKLILLNVPQASETGISFLETVPCEYSFSEYQMKWAGGDLNTNPDVVIRPSISKEDFEAEIQLDVQCFNDDYESAKEFLESIKNEDIHRYIIEIEGKQVGKIRINESNSEAWIYGFAVFPEFQGKGIGRSALFHVVKIEADKGNSVFLEVEAGNANALKLYESCGFRTYHSQDYYVYQNQ